MGGTAGPACHPIFQGRIEEARSIDVALSASDQSGADTRRAVGSTTADMSPALVRVFESRAAEAAPGNTRQEESARVTSAVATSAAALMKARLNRRYEDMAEEMVWEVLELREIGFSPEYQWSRVFVPLIWGLAPSWRAALESGWRRLHGNTTLLL